MPATGANEGEEFKKAKQIRTPKGREGATRCDYIKHPSNKPEPGPQTAATDGYQHLVVEGTPR